MSSTLSSGAKKPSEKIDDGLQRIARLISPFGLVSRTGAVLTPAGDPHFAVQVAAVGDPSRVLHGMQQWAPGADVGNINGVGSALSTPRARLVAVAESLERYSLCSWHPGDMITSAERDLTVEHISPSRFPTLSASELSSPSCRLRAYDPTVPIRWVRGWSLTRSREVLVPAVAVYLNLPTSSASEEFTRSVTTGAAVHSDYHSAALGGLLEVVERDALSLAWLQRLRLPTLELSTEDLDLTSGEALARSQSRNLETRLFDATTDFGIPVVYAVQMSDSDRDLAQIVAATCDMDPQRAVGKIFRELAALRIALSDHVERFPVRRPAEDEVSVVGAAVFNAALERRVAFDHLLDSGPRDRRCLQDLPAPPAGQDPLARAVRNLDSCGAEVIAVDITPDEARSVDMVAVKVLVPEAVPLSFVHAERYLATPRLYTAPKAMGHFAGSEAQINPEPQPFA